MNVQVFIITITFKIKNFLYVILTCKNKIMIVVNCLLMSFKNNPIDL